jgi:hypothetical protein
MLSGIYAVSFMLCHLCCVIYALSFMLCHLCCVIYAVIYAVSFMLSETNMPFMLCRHAKCQYAEFLNAKRHYTDCRGVIERVWSGAGF